MGDLAGGLFAAQGILAALYQREKTGRGQMLDISLLIARRPFSLTGPSFILLEMKSHSPLVQGMSPPIPSGHFGPRHSISSLMPNTENIFAELCRAIGSPEMCVNPKFTTRQNRLKNKKELYSILDEVFLTKTGEEWLEILEAKIPIAPINSIDKALADPQTPIFATWFLRWIMGTGRG